MLVGYAEYRAAKRSLILKNDVLDSNIIFAIKNIKFFAHIFLLYDKIFMHLLKKMSLPLILRNWEGVEDLEKSIFHIEIIFKLFLLIVNLKLY